MPPKTITDETKFVSASQAIKSPRWKFSNTTFYKMVNSGQIKRRYPYPNARPVYSVAEIDALYSPEKEEMPVVRVKKFAELMGTDAPSQLTNNQNSPTQELLDFCVQTGCSLDWVFTGSL